MVHYPKEIFLCSSAEESFAIFLHFVVHCVYTRVATLLSFIMIRTQKPSLSLAFVADSKVIVITQILMQIFTIGSTTKPKSYFFPTVFFSKNFFSFLPSLLLPRQKHSGGWQSIYLWTWTSSVNRRHSYFVFLKLKILL